MKIIVGDDPDEHFAITHHPLQQLLGGCDSPSQVTIRVEGSLDIKGITGRMLGAGSQNRCQHKIKYRLFWLSHSASLAAIRSSPQAFVCTRSEKQSAGNP